MTASELYPGNDVLLRVGAILAGTSRSSQDAPMEQTLPAELVNTRERKPRLSKLAMLWVEPQRF